jgi:glycosyltransferase involved in cell wall biosynthesis
MKSKETVMLLIPDLGSGGAERSFSKLSAVLSERYKVIVVSFSNQVSAYPVFGEHIILDAPPNRLVLFRWIHRVRSLMKIKKKYDVAVSISFLEGAAYANVLSRYRKTIISVRGSLKWDLEIRGFAGWIRKKILIPLLFKRADRVVTVSKGLYHEMIDSFHVPTNRLRLITNFYDTAEIVKASSMPIPNNLRVIFERTVIITVGRLHPQKQHHGLLRVFREIASPSDCTLLIVGDGPLKMELVNYADHLGLKIQDLSESSTVDQQANVYFLSYVENPFKYIRNSTILILPSSWEGFPNVILESMLCKTPVLAADCPTGPREIIAPELPSQSLFRDSTYRNQFGSLLPLLTKPSAQIISMWKSEIEHYLSSKELCSKVAEEAFVRAMEFDTNLILQNWFRVIDE